MRFDFYFVMYRYNDFEDWKSNYFSSLESACDFVVDNLILYGIPYKVLGMTDLSDEI